MLSANPLTRAYWLRLERAKEQLEALRTEIESFTGNVRQGETFEIGCEKNSNANGYICKLFNVRSPDYLRWSISVGEIVQNFRVPLDQLAFALVHSSGTAKPDGKTAFPIFEEFDKYHAAGRYRKNGFESSGLRKVQGMDGTVRALIETLQPYNKQRMGRGLHILDQLWRIDKHHHPLLGTAASAFQIGSAVTWGENPPDLTFKDHFPFEEGAEVGTADRPMEVHAQIAVQVQFREAGPWGAEPIADALTLAGEGMADALIQLEPFVKWAIS